MKKLLYVTGFLLLLGCDKGSNSVGQQSEKHTIYYTASGTAHSFKITYTTPDGTESKVVPAVGNQGARWESQSYTFYTGDHVMLKLENSDALTVGKIYLDDQEWKSILLSGEGPSTAEGIIP